MKTTHIKILIDLTMLLLLIALMGPKFTGLYIHEIAGLLYFLLFIAHNLINLQYYRKIFKGHYTPKRIFQLTINILLLLNNLALLLSSLAISKLLFPELLSFKYAYKTHIFTANWIILLTSIHLGLHIPFLKNGLKIRKPRILLILQTTCLLLAIYGAFAFIHSEFYAKLILLNLPRIKFSIITYYLNHIAIITLFTTLTHYFNKKSSNITQSIMNQ